jgi:hypothetical protein
LRPLDPHGHGGGVIGVVRLGCQDREHVFAHPTIRGPTSPNDAPEIVLVAGLAHDLEGLLALVQLDLHAVAHPGRPLL